MRGASGKTVLLAFAIGAVMLVAAIWLRSSLSSKPLPVAQPSATPTVRQVAVAPPAPEEPAPATAIPPPPAAPAAPDTSSVAVAAKKAAPSGARTAPKPKANCDPNFYLDGQGEKHFKPECFR
jgi:hypothetical protein